jgi:hypothetical protein
VDKTRGPQWWIGHITDLSDGVKKVIGSIETNSSVAKATNWNNFIEYWGQAVPCDAVGAASAKFYTPTSNNPDVEVSSPRFSRPAQPCAMSAGDTPPQGFIGDAVIRFGGAKQAPSTETLPYTKTRAQLAAEMDPAELKAKQEAEVKAAAELKAKQDAAADKTALTKAQAELMAANAALADSQKINREQAAKLSSFEELFKVLSESVATVQNQLSQLNSKLVAAIAGQNAANAKLKKVCSAKPKPKGC